MLHPETQEFLIFVEYSLKKSMKYLKKGGIVEKRGEEETKSMP
jgi:hypothetical protein